MIGLGYSDFGARFALFEVLWFVMFFIFIAVFATAAIKGISQWNKNNHSPRLTVDATIVSKRTNISRHRHGHAGDVHRHTSTSTTYFVTFQVESGDRMEFSLAGHEYGLLIEGDKGKLTFQGTRYLGFERTL